MEAAKFTFVPLKDKKSVLGDPKKNNKLMQWSLKGTLKVKYYNFNQEFHPYQKQEFLEAFFKDPSVYSTLQVFNSAWKPIGIAATKVEYQLIPSTITSMSFFDRVLDPANNITRVAGEIRQCMEDQCEGFYIDDNVLTMLLVEEHETYKLFSKSERNEFIFNLFKHLYLGGEWCQREFSIEPYLQFTKELYKELMSVERIEGSTSIKIRSVVFKVVAFYDEKPLCPTSPHHLQNFAYLIVDPFKRQLAVLTNHYGASVDEYGSNASVFVS